MTRPALWFLTLPTIVAAVVAIAQGPAAAVPFFAHQYELSCQKCHTEIPALNAFGQEFFDHGYRMPGGVTAGSAFPISAKLNFVYSSATDPTLPKAVVDEIELFLAGRLNDRTNYFIEQYVVDGGQHGLLRDGWLGYRLSGTDAKTPLNLQLGQFTLPLPLDPESFRETVNHYAIYDQTVGNNPFSFFEPKVGAHLRVGSSGRGTSVHLVAAQGHDRQSGIASLGTDTMIEAQHAMGAVTLSAYRYAGRRPDEAFVDRFTRYGYGVAFETRKLRFDAIQQTGWDSTIDGLGNGGSSSGGFAQLRYAFTPKIFGLARYDATNDAVNGKARSGTILAGYRVSRNSRLTAEDVITNVPAATHTFNLQYTVGY